MLKKTKIFIVILIIINLALAGVLWYFSGVINIHSEKALSSTAELDFEVKKEEKLRSTEAIIRDTEEERVELDSRFVKDEEVVDFIKLIENIGEKTGVVVDIKTVSVIDTDFGFSEALGLQVEYIGNWSETMHFLSLIEELPFSIEIISFSSDKKEGDELLWQSSLGIEVLKLKNID